MKYNFFGTLSILALGLSALVVSSCDKKDKVVIEGKRETIFLNQEILKPDDSAKDIEINFSNVEANESWPQASGNASHNMSPVELGESLTLAWDANIGSGSGGENRLINGPVSAEGLVFTIDSDGVIRASSLKDGSLKWEVDSRPENIASQPFSGGLAYDNETLFVATAYAEVLALDPKTGAIKWRSSVNSPVRAAPSVKDGRVYVISINNQLDVLESESGKILWTHNGIMETAGILGGANVAVHNGVAVVPYSSGEVFALRVDNGYPLWSESLSSLTRVDSVSSLAHIKARPVIDNGKVFLISNSGKVSAINLSRGQTMWSKEIGGIRSPAVSDGLLFLVTNENELVCLTQEEGLVVWTKTLPRFLDAEKSEGKVLWAGPILASENRLVLAGSNGKALILSAKTGEEVAKLELPGQTLISPIIVDKTLLFLTDDAVLAAYR